MSNIRSTLLIAPPQGQMLPQGTNEILQGECLVLIRTIRLRSHTQTHVMSGYKDRTILLNSSSSMLQQHCNRYFSHHGWCNKEPQASYLVWCIASVNLKCTLLSFLYTSQVKTYAALQTDSLDFRYKLVILLLYPHLLMNLCAITSFAHLSLCINYNICSEAIEDCKIFEIVS